VDDAALYDEAGLTGASRSALEDRLSRLLAENGAALGRLAAGYTRTAADRDDLLQDIALAVWQALPRFRGECSDRTFLFRVAHNRAIAYATRRRLALQAIDEECGEAESMRTPAPNPEAALSKAEEAARFVAAVRRLPMLYRQTIILALEGLSYREMAEVLGIAESNVGARLTRARQALRTLMGRTS